MRMHVTYIDANNTTRTMRLYDAKWATVRGRKVLKGQQKIRGKLVNRTLADDEIVTWSVVS